MFLRHGDHPRVCGEKDPVFPGLLLHLGSPPRVRGKEFWGCCCAGCHRITPACAGKSCNLSGVLCQFRDHPRVCGEKSGKLSLAHRSKGSPPRVRGKELDFLPGFFGDRITPACAGKSAKAVTIEAIQKDHPRVCGEKCCCHSHTWPALGSPPRVRGKAILTSMCRFCSRITPACAGKSQRIPNIRRFRRDHPRVCGEKCATLQIHKKVLGSPPRVRGKD